MLRPFLTKILGALAATVATSMLVWAMLPLAPGDPVEMILQAQNVEEPTDQQIANLRLRFGLDDPLWARYLSWAGNVMQGDFGLSWSTGRPVLDGLAARLPATLQLVMTGLVISLLWSLLLALVAACHVGRWPDRLVLGYTRVTAAVPAFILGLLVLQFVVVGMGIGQVLSSGSTATLVLAALVIGIDRAAGWTQLLRAALLEQMASGPADVARARGASEGRILTRYALPGAILPWLTAVGISLGGLIGGSPVLETIFTWPGLGQYVLQALSVRDLPIIQAFVMFAVLAYIGASLLVDLIAMLIDPRLRERPRP